MALFSNKNKQAGKETPREKTEKRAASVGSGETPRAAESGRVLLRPRITEKSSYLTADGGYTFEVTPNATKPEIKKAVAALYNVTPVSVNTVRIPAKKISVRGKTGVRSGGKKAIVYLKEGERIEFV